MKKLYAFLSLFVVVNASFAMEIEKKEEKKKENEQLVCVNKPIHTVLFYGSSHPKLLYKQGIFITVFDKDNKGEVYSPDCSGVLKKDIEWSASYEDMKGKAVAFHHIKIGETYYSGIIEISDTDKGIIKILKNKMDFM